MSSPRIDVLLSTYNGERYLGEQLQSLWEQTCQDFTVLVRDDGSTDGTVALLRKAVVERPGRIQLVTDGESRLGPRDSFAKLMSIASAPYYAFCDQDDHWLPDKLALLLAAVQSVEQRRGTDCPVLCCSDVVVADEDLRATDPSYFAKHRISARDGRDLALRRLIFRNYAIGATTMINAALARQCTPVPHAAIMHDWWCALVATALGEAVVLSQPLMLYRQHGGNAIGSKRRGLPRSRRQAAEALAWSRTSVVRCVGQAQALRSKLAGRLNPSDRALLDAYADFDRQSPFRRAATILRTRAFKPGLALNSLHLYACLTASL